MTEAEYNDLYSNGFARTVKTFLKFLDQDDAEDWAQEVFLRVWERRKEWNRKYSIVSFWHLQVRDCIYDLRKTFGKTIEVPMFEGEERVYFDNTDFQIDVERVSKQLPPYLIDYLWLKTKGHSIREATQMIVDATGEQVTRQALEKRIERILDACPELHSDIEEVLRTQ